MIDQCSNDVNNIGFDGCYDFDFQYVSGGKSKAAIINPETELFVRLCNKGIYPFQVTVTEKIVIDDCGKWAYLIDANDRFVGTFENSLGYEVRKPKPNNQLTKDERVLLKKYNLLK